MATSQVFLLILLAGLARIAVGCLPCFHSGSPGWTDRSYVRSFHRALFFLTCALILKLSEGLVQGVQLRIRKFSENHLSLYKSHK